MVVTGAAGFIGRHVVARLRALGYRVVGVDRRPWLPVAGETAMVADLTRAPRSVREALRRADGVIHLAGRPGVRDSSPGTARRRYLDNVVAGQVVCRTTPLDRPLVVVSSSSVYGGAQVPVGGTEPRPSHEDDPPRPLGGYATSKLALEAECDRRAAAGGRVTVLRPFTVAGEGQRPDMALSRWIEAARVGRPLVLLGGHDRCRDVTDVRDVADGLVRAVERGAVGTINLGTGRTHGLLTMASTVADALGVELVTTTRPAGPAEAVATRAHTARCDALLGFVPRTDLRDLIERQIAATISRPVETTRLLASEAV